MMVDGRCTDMSAVSILKATQPCIEPVRCKCRRGCRRHLANTIEPSTCGGDASFCQITL